MTEQLIQGTPEWHTARLGKVTASRISDVMAKPKSGRGTSVSRANYAAQLIRERLTHEWEKGFFNEHTKRGIELEPMARAAYEFETDNQVVEVGFVPHPTITMSGASPDGLIGDDGITQIKCRNATKHIAYLLNGKIGNDEFLQVQWEMACTKRNWCHFVNFNPGFPPSMQLFIKHIDRDDERICEMEKEVVQFLIEVNEQVEKLKDKFK